MTGPYNWSPAMAAVRKAHVLDPVHDDPRTDRGKNLVLGHPLPYIRASVLEWGLTDFRRPVDLSGGPPLSPGEKVLLDCYVNMRRHFFACTAVYQAFRSVLKKLLKSAARPVVFDIGCGAATAGLALADRFPRRPFDYVGIDSAPAMLDKARELWGAAKAGGLVRADSTAAFHPSWEGLDPAAVAPDRPVLVLFSYFFTGRPPGSAVVRSLANFVLGLATGRATDLTAVYVNPPKSPAGNRYDEFVRYLGFDPAAFPPSPMTIEYRTLGGEPPGKEEFVYDLFHVLGG